MKNIDSIPVWGNPIDNAVEQMKCINESAEHVALMADHHLGYSMPIGGIAAYKGMVSPSGVGYDIACGNMAVKLDTCPDGLGEHISDIMDCIYSEISFGMGRINKEEVGHELFHDDPAWDIPVASELKDMARRQLGTVGSGNHYVDLFISDNQEVWCGVHFGSRGLGHKLATHFVKEGGGVDSIHAAPTLIDASSQLGQEYIACMKLAGRYAYAGREWVCNKVAKIIDAQILDTVHNHHNFAWEEEHYGEKYWVIRKGATPAFPGQRGFVGGSMGDISVIIEGVEGEGSKESLYSTVHGAGRVMSRTQAAGKRRWKKGKIVSQSEGEVSRKMMEDWIGPMGVELRGAGVDESPHCYKRIKDVLGYHSETIKVTEVLNPVGVAMAGADVFDPFKD